MSKKMSLMKDLCDFQIKTNQAIPEGQIKS